MAKCKREEGDLKVDLALNERDGRGGGKKDEEEKVQEDWMIRRR